MLNAKQNRNKQNTHTEIQKPKHEPTNSLKKQRSEAAPLTLLALHLYSQTANPTIYLAYTAAWWRKWVHKITAKLASPSFYFAK